MYNRKFRSGAVLIIVAGIASILIALCLSLVSLSRQDAQYAIHFEGEAQARLMLQSALMYIQESSRIGWGEHGDDLCFGWTDVRDGGLGPRAARQVSGKGVDRDPDNIVPSWWKWGTYRAHGGDNMLPSVATRTWPCPGSAIRAPMPVFTRPPMAMLPLLGVNAPTPRTTYGESGYDDYPMWESGNNLTSLDKRFAADLPSPSRQLGSLDNQPVASTWQEFVRGEELLPNSDLSELRYATRAGTSSRGWFRIYRETLGDHDANGRSGAYSPNANAVWELDSVALYDPLDPNEKMKNWNVFIIACGSGGTHGFRFWDRSDDGYSFALDPITAKDSGLFTSEDQFRSLRARETILFYRVEWTPLNGGQAHPSVIDWRGSRYPRDQFLTQMPSGSQIIQGGVTDAFRNRIASHGGNFSWIQRLRVSPPNW